MGSTHITITRRWPASLNAMLLLAASFIAIAALSFQARPGAEIVAVAFPVWWDSHEAFSAAASANAAIVRVTAIPSLLVVRPTTARDCRGCRRPEPGSRSIRKQSQPVSRSRTTFAHWGY